MHKHHIMPRSLGGTNDPDNLVEISVEEHAKIHHIPCKNCNEVKSLIS